MIFNTRSFLMLPLITILIGSCKNDNCNDPIAFNYDPDGSAAKNCIYEPKQISLQIDAQFEDKPLILKDTFQLEGRAIIFEYYGIYLSKLSFQENGKDSLWGNDVLLLREGKDLPVENILQSVYLNRHPIDGIMFDIGVDTSYYKADPMDTTLIPTSSPLSLKTPAMYWGWAGGYRFVSIEGMVDTSAAKDHSGMTHFEFHCGLPNNLKTVSLDKPIAVLNRNKINLELNVQFDILLNGIDFQTTDLVIHDGNNPTTIKIMNNAQNAISFN